MWPLLSSDSNRRGNSVQRPTWDERSTRMIRRACRPGGARWSSVPHARTLQTRRVNDWRERASRLAGPQKARKFRGPRQRHGDRLDQWKTDRWAEERRAASVTWYHNRPRAQACLFHCERGHPSPTSVPAGGRHSWQRKLNKPGWEAARKNRHANVPRFYAAPFGRAIDSTMCRDLPKNCQTQGHSTVRQEYVFWRIKIVRSRLMLARNMGRRRKSNRLYYKVCVLDDDSNATEPEI